MRKKSRNKGGKSSRTDGASSNAGGSSSRETMLDALVFESSVTDRTKRLGIRRISSGGVGRRPADELAGRRVVEVPDLGSVVGGVWSGSGSREACCGERPGKLTPPLFPPYQTCTIATTKSRSQEILITHTLSLSVFFCRATPSRSPVRILDRPSSCAHPPTFAKVARKGPPQRLVGAGPA
jgi:hypothetical protein